MGGEKIIEEAYRLLYPEREFPYLAAVRYTDHFNDYGANVKLRGNALEFGLSRKWRSVSREIRIGLFQELMLKLFSKRRPDRKDMNLMYVDLYNSFVKNLHIAIPKTDIEPALSESFDRVNEKYFYGIVEKPNLVWGSKSRASLGSYDYKADTIKISRIFQSLMARDPELLDVVMYHEILHKSHKYKHKGGSNRFHDSDFRKKEKEFENFHEVDQRLKNALRRARIKKLLWFD